MENEPSWEKESGDLARHVFYTLRGYTGPSQKSPEGGTATDRQLELELHRQAKAIALIVKMLHDSDILSTAEVETFIEEIST